MQGSRPLIRRMNITIAMKNMMKKTTATNTPIYSAISASLSAGVAEKEYYDEHFL